MAAESSGVFTPVAKEVRLHRFRRKKAPPTPSAKEIREQASRLGTLIKKLGTLTNELKSTIRKNRKTSSRAKRICSRNGKACSDTTGE